jgi:hypothetical protein
VACRFALHMLEITQFGVHALHELAAHNFPEARLFHGVAQRLLVVDELMAPGADELVDQKSVVVPRRVTGAALDLGIEEVSEELALEGGSLARGRFVGAVQIDEKREVRRHDSRHASRCEHPEALAEQILTLGESEMLDHVLAEDIVERGVFERKPPGRVEMEDVTGLRMVVGIEPARQEMPAAADLELLLAGSRQVRADQLIVAVELQPTRGAAAQRQEQLLLRYPPQ